MSPWLDSRVPLATSHLSWVTVDHANHTFLHHHHHHHRCLHYNQYVSFPILLIYWETSTVSGRVPFPKKVMVMNSWNLINWVMIMMTTMMVAMMTMMMVMECNLLGERCQLPCQAHHRALGWVRIAPSRANIPFRRLLWPNFRCFFSPSIVI